MSYVLQGSMGSPGLRFGTLVQLQISAPVLMVADQDPADALVRFATAQQEVAAQLERIGAELRVDGQAEEAEIFDAQAMLVADPLLSNQVEQLVGGGASLPEAVAQAARELASTLSALDDPYLQARAADVHAVGEQLLATLSGRVGDVKVPPGAIVVAQDLTPTQTAALRKQAIAGFATAGGSTTGHVAILARALGIPAIVGVGAQLLDAPDGAAAILDAANGQLIVEPTADDIARYEALHAQQEASAKRRLALIDLPATTSDGRRVQLWANIGHPDEAQFAREQGAEGIGLFRTEFLFLDRTAPPDEDEQYQAYVAALQHMAGRPVIVRTIDVGGDKPITYLSVLEEPNPFLGHRGIRFAMCFPELFQTQLRALLRAAVHGDLRIMLPMVATPEDIAWTQAQIEAAAQTLTAAAKEHRADPPLGIMIETPAAALTLDLLTNNIQFCSIGSNDLAQYTLAVDRGTSDLAARYPHNDPAVFRLLRLVADSAQRLGIELSICGELAGDATMSIALVGVGIEKLSMAPSALLSVKEALRAVSYMEAQQQGRTACRET